MSSVTINGRKVNGKPGRTILEFARDAGIIIPTLCYHKDLSVAGSCRLCLVEVEGLERQLAACSQPILDGMVVWTETPKLVETRRFILELLLRHYCDAVPAAGHAAETEFQHFASRTDLSDLCFSLALVRWKLLWRH